jgi:hypothetical protein
MRLAVLAKGDAKGDQMLEDGAFRGNNLGSDLLGREALDYVFLLEERLIAVTRLPDKWSNFKEFEPRKPVFGDSSRWAAIK